MSIERTTRRYFSKANECITTVLKTVCPEDVSLVRKSLFEKPSIPEKDTSSSFLEAIASSYMKANTFTLRRHLLSIATNDYSFAEVSAQIHGLTRYTFYSAKKHAQDVGIGIPVEPSKIPRSKIDDLQLDHFLDFITSNHLIKDLPLGEKSRELSTGELILTPNVIRSLAPATIIRQYTQLCEEENIKRLGIKLKQSSFFFSSIICSALFFPILCFLFFNNMQYFDFFPQSFGSYFNENIHFSSTYINSLYQFLIYHL